MQRLAALLAAAALLLAAPLATAAPRILSAPEIRAELETGEMILLDIRSEAEWQETGLAEGAWPVTLHSPDFPKALQAILARYSPEKVAIICATGGRTGHVSRVLEKNGITGIVDVSEGMLGNRVGPGWIKRGLPIVPLQDAIRAYAAAMGNPAN